MLKAAGKIVLLKERIRACNINIVLIADKEIKKLNKKYRKVNRITDVISFNFNSKPLAGDIYIAKQRSVKQAKAQKHGWKKELAYLVMHGILHLIGYSDYVKSQRRRMFLRQDRYFRCLFS